MLDGWRDLINDDFHFYFEATSQQIADISTALGEIVHPRGHHWGGWVCREGDEYGEFIPSVWYDGQREPRKKRAVVEQLHGIIGGRDRGFVVVQSPNEPWEVASNMSRLVELMGYGLKRV